MKRIIFYFCALCIGLIVFQGCIIVKNDGGDDTPVVLNLSPKPEIPMSDELVRSKKGDMIALLPQGWHYLNVEEDASSDIIAVAVNPDYNLSAVFSTIRNSDELDEVVTREGLLGLARQSLANHAKKTAGAVKQVGKYSTINMGSQSFAQYEFSNGSPLITKAVVFISSIDEYYEFALIPMNVSGKPLPSQPEIDKIFRSILTTVQY